MICQLFIKRKKRGACDILASGGRYDSLIASFASRLNLEEERNRINQAPFGVGISIGLDSLAAAIQDEELADKAFARLDVLIQAPVGISVKQTRLLELSNQLWNCGIRCSICDPGWHWDEVQDHAKEAGADFVVIYQDNVIARLRTLTDTERFTEKKTPIPEVFETLAKMISDEQSNAGGTGSHPGASISGGCGSTLMRIDSTSRMPDHMHCQSVSSSAPQVNIDWQFFPDRKNATVKKRLEATINTKMLPIWSKFVSSTEVQVFVLPFQGQVIRTLVATIDFDLEDDLKFNDCLKEVIAKHSRHKKVFLF